MSESSLWPVCSRVERTSSVFTILLPDFFSSSSSLAMTGESGSPASSSPSPSAVTSDLR